MGKQHLFGGIIWKLVGGSYRFFWVRHDIIGRDVMTNKVGMIWGNTLGLEIRLGSGPLRALREQDGQMISSSATMQHPSVETITTIQFENL